MKAKMKDSSRILAAVYETAQDLHSAGSIDKCRMQHFNILCCDPVWLAAQESQESALMCQGEAHDLFAQPDAMLAHTLDGLGDRNVITPPPGLDQDAD